MKILIALATFNRPIITDLCLKNLQVVRNDLTKVVIYDDHSEAYSEEYLNQYADEVIRFKARGGIERSRARAFRDFLINYSQYDLLYLTDNDAIHDPAFTQVLRDAFAWQNQFPEEINPVGLFNSVFHREKIIAESEEFFLSETCPGISMCYTRDMVSSIVEYLDQFPAEESSYGWDMNWPRVLGRPFLLPKISYVEHFARDRFEGGMHSNNSGLNSIALMDFERDRALYPSDYLVAIRPSIIKTILGF